VEINHPVAIFAVVMAVISFYGCTYAVIALNVGWRFGYWVASATLGGLMVLMSLFWLKTALGPRGEEPHWIPIAVDAAEVTSATFEEQTFTSPASFPGGPWESADAEEERASEFASALSTCLSTDPEDLAEEERATCEAAQGLLPSRDDIPRIDGVRVAMTTETTEVAFASEAGANLAQATVLPITRDPRLAGDDPFAPLGNAFQLVAISDEGSVRLPAYGSTAVFLLYFGFHLWGLRRAERRRLSPVAA